MEGGCSRGPSGVAAGTLGSGVKWKFSGLHRTVARDSEGKHEEEKEKDVPQESRHRSHVKNLGTSHRSELVLRERQDCQSDPPRVHELDLEPTLRIHPHHHPNISDLESMCRDISAKDHPPVFLAHLNSSLTGK
jgi:hypothetical protein